MKSIKLDDQEIRQFTDTDTLLWANDMLEVGSQLEKRLISKINKERDICFIKFKEYWNSDKLEKLGVQSIPTDRDEFVNLITARDDYFDAFFFQQLANYWLPRLQQLGIDPIPRDRTDFVKLVTERDDYLEVNPKNGDVSSKTIKIDTKLIHTISETDMKIFQFVLPEPDAAIKYALCWIIDEKVKGCSKRLLKEWDESGKLATLGVTSIPTKIDELVTLITDRPEYKNRVTRDAEEAAEEAAAEAAAEAAK